MKFIFVIRVLVLAFFVLTSTSTISAQYNLGVEGGATMSSLFSYQKGVPTSYTPKVGARGGLFVERELCSLFLMKTGVFYELKGANQLPSPTNAPWNLHYISVPILFEVRPIKPLIIGLGIEGSVLVSNDIPLLAPSRFNLGLRAEATWQIGKAFRIMLHGAVDLLPTTNLNFTNEQGQPLFGNNPVNFSNFSAGVSLAYIIKTFDKK